MFQASQFLPERVRARLGPRAVGLGLALLLEAILLLLLLSLGQARLGRPDETVTVVDFAAQDVADHPPAQEPAAEPERAPEPQQAREPAPAPAPDPMPQPDDPPRPVASPPPPIVPVLRPSPAPVQPAPQPAQQPAAPAQTRVYGPPAPSGGSGSGDTARVGTAPNGEPMYAAAWYRRPAENELRGYLSTASGPGWGLIACKTVEDFRVEDCVGLDEYPQGSQIVRSVLAAAWQFRVRPPRRGGKSLVGAWVRIRIDYDLRRE